MTETGQFISKKHTESGEYVSGKHTESGEYISSSVLTGDGNNAKITQQYIEAAVTTDNRSARVTQQYIEAACLIVPVGYNHKINGIMNPSKIYGLSTFTKVNSI